MADSVFDLLRRCTTRIILDGGTKQGTGFFVAPGRILTCAHVVADAAPPAAKAIEVQWDGGSYSARVSADGFKPSRDLALLDVDVADHPCVLLNDAFTPNDALFSYGFPGKRPGGDSVTANAEGWTRSDDAAWEWLKFKSGQVWPGLSGAPLLNLETGSVCGVVKRTRDEGSDLGGFAVSTREVTSEFPTLSADQVEYHRRNTNWRDLATKRGGVAYAKASTTKPAMTGSRVSIFYSYAHEDEGLQVKLLKQLALLRKQGRIEDWHDRDIRPGDEWEARIDQRLQEAQIILLLVSANFLASDYCYDVELDRAMKRHRAGDARVIPIILSPCDWHSAPFGILKALPRDAKPISKWGNQAEAFADVARGIRSVVDHLNPEPS